MASSTGSHRATIPHLPALDGLRGLAVLGVLFFHADGLLVGGYLGVDLFFVLSGFLITSILLAEQREAGRIDLGRFWVRRARRLFPALLSLMPAIGLYALVFAKPDELASLRRDALATLGYVANWREIFADKSYWDLFAAPSPLEHTWSLAIEEQFYVLWPLLFTLVLVVLRGTRRTLFWVSLGLTALSVSAMVLLYTPASTSRAYFGTDTRAAAITVGIALACSLGVDRKMSAGVVRALDVLGLVSLVGLGVAWATLDGQNPFLYRGGFWLTELASLSLIACAVAGPGSLVGRVLGLGPFAYVGTISYGVYLWHWPVFCVLTVERTHLGTLSLNLLRFAVTFAIAVPSFRYFERPIRSHGLPFGRPYYVVPVSFIAAALVVWGATTPRPVPLAVHPTPAAMPSTVVEGKTWPTPFSVEVNVLPPPRELPPGTLRILVVGDSVAEKLGVALRYRQEDAHTFVAQRGVGNCSILESLTVTPFQKPHPDPGHGCAGAWVSDVTDLQPDVTLIVLGGGYYAQMTIDGKSEGPCDRGWHDAYRARLEQLLDEMGPTAGSVMVAIVPYPMGRWRYEGVPKRVDCFNALLSEVAKARGLPTVDLFEHLCPTPECAMFSDGEPIRPDGLHPDGKGAEEMSRWTLSEIRRQLPDAGGAR